VVLQGMKDLKFGKKFYNNQDASKPGDRKGAMWPQKSFERGLCLG